MVDLWRRDVPRHRVAVCSRQMRSQSENEITSVGIDAIAVLWAMMSWRQLCVRARV
jgi:hypothetical protein